MLNLQLLQRQRARLYKNELRRQFQQKQQMRKNQSMQLRSRDQEQLKQKIDIAMQEMKYEKQRDFILQNKLKQDNMRLATIKNMNKEVEQEVQRQVPLKGNSLLQTLYQQADQRGSQVKFIAKKLSDQNHQQQNLHKSISKQIKSHQIVEDQRHLQRLKQLEMLRRQQYQEIKSRHSPQPKVGQIHKKLQDLNQSYRKQLQSFAYNGKDILDSLKRDESKQIFQKNKRVQSQLKYQIEEKKFKDQMSNKEYIGKPDDLRKSLLASVLFKSPNYDKKQYANFLARQINETDARKSLQKVENKQKVEIGSIFGGQGGPERLKMIKFIDQNLGIQSEYLKNIEPGTTSSSPYRIKKIYQFNEQSPSHRQIRKNTEQRQRDSIHNPQKTYTEAEKVSQNSNRKPQSINGDTIRLSSSRAENYVPKSYLGYDLIKGSQKRYQV